MPPFPKEIWQLKPLHTGQQGENITKFDSTRNVTSLHFYHELITIFRSFKNGESLSQEKEYLQKWKCILSYILNTNLMTEMEISKCAQTKYVPYHLWSFLTK